MGALCDITKRLASSYRAFVWLLAGVAPHVDHQHVLRLEGLLLSRALVPAAHKLLLLAVDVVVVDVLRERSQSQYRVGRRGKQLIHLVSLHCHPGSNGVSDSAGRLLRFFVTMSKQETLKVVCFFSLRVFFSRKGNFSFYFSGRGQEVIKEVRCDTSCLMPSRPDSPVYHCLSLKKRSHGRKNNKNNNKLPHRKEIGRAHV